MILHIGQKVVCIDDSPNPKTIRYTPLRPRKGEIYTIRGFLVFDHIPGYGVYLEELPNPSQMWGDTDECEWAFNPDRFRPVVKLELPAERTAQDA